MGEGARGIIGISKANLNCEKGWKIKIDNANVNLNFFLESSLRALSSKIEEVGHDCYAENLKNEGIREL